MSNVYAVAVLALLWLLLTLGQQIRTGRVSRGWTQEILAERLGVDPRTVQRWEQNEIYPRPSRIVAMQQWFTLKQDEMLVSSPHDAAIKAYLGDYPEYLGNINEYIGMEEYHG